MWQPAEGGETISAAEAGYASPDAAAAPADVAPDAAPDEAIVEAEAGLTATGDAEVGEPGGEPD